MIYDEHILFCRQEEREVQFLTAGDPAHQVLVQHINSSVFLEQLNLATHGRHTGQLEVLHSMFLTYVNKRIDYDPPSYSGRIQLALLDHNENCQRKKVLGMLNYNSVVLTHSALLYIWCSS